LLTGFSLPQAEWLALPEHVEQMKERPREFWRHFTAVLLALCGLDTVSDLASVVGRRVARPAGRTLAVVAVKAVMLHALLALALGSFLSDPQRGDRQVNLFPFLPTDYAGQWAELAIAVIGDVLLLLTVTRAGATGLETRSVHQAPGDGTADLSDSVEKTYISATPRRDG
jgi:hypothetical protein